MTPADLDAAISHAAATNDVLRATLRTSGPVEAMVLTPLILQAIGILNTLAQLKSALREVAA